MTYLAAISNTTRLAQAKGENLSHFKYNKIGTGKGGKFKSFQSTTYLAVISNTTRLAQAKGEKFKSFQSTTYLAQAKEGKFK